MQARQVLAQQFPGMEVLGSAYPVPAHKVCQILLSCFKVHPHLYLAPGQSLENV